MKAFEGNGTAKWLLGLLLAQIIAGAILFGQNLQRMDNHESRLNTIEKNFAKLEERLDADTNEDRKQLTRLQLQVARMEITLENLLEDIRGSQTPSRPSGGVPSP